MDVLEIGSDKNEDLLSSSSPRGCGDSTSASSSGRDCSGLASDDSEHHGSHKSSHGEGHGRVISVIAFIILLVIFVMLWIGLFSGSTFGSSRDSTRSGWFNSKTLGGLLVAIVIVFIIMMALVWVIDTNPSWGCWVGGIILFLAIILILCGVIGAGNRRHH